MISKSLSKSKFIKTKFKWHFENYNFYIYNFYHILLTRLFEKLCDCVWKERDCVLSGCWGREAQAPPSWTLTPLLQIPSKGSPRWTTRSANMAHRAGSRVDDPIWQMGKISCFISILYFLTSKQNTWTVSKLTHLIKNQIYSAPKPLKFI